MSTLSSRNELIVKAINRRDDMLRSAQNYQNMRGWYLQRAETMSKIINRLDKKI